MGRDSSDISAGLILIVLASVFILLTKSKIFYGYVGNLYYGKCLVMYKDKELCQKDREFILSLSKYDKVINIGGNKENEEDKVIIENIKQKIVKEVLPIHLILLSVEGLLVFGIYSGLFNKNKLKLFSNKHTKRSNNVPQELLNLFNNPEMKKAVLNFYSFSELSKDNIERLKKMKESEVQDEVLFAGFMLLARSTMNFSAGQVAKGINDEFIRGIIFSSGRPSVPLDYEDYFDVAKSLLSSFENPQT